MKHLAFCVALALMLAMIPATAIGTELWIPAAASNPGLHGSMWSTDLWLMNRVVDASIEVTAAFFPDQEGTGAPEEAVITLGPGSQIEISDAVMQPEFHHEFRMKGGEQFVYEMTTVMRIFAARKLDAWGCEHPIGDWIQEQNLTARENRLLS